MDDMWNRNMYGITIKKNGLVRIPLPRFTGIDIYNV